MKTGKIIADTAVVLALGILMCGGNEAFHLVPSAEASNSAANNKAATQYSKKARQLESRASGGINAKHGDLTGDGVDEAIFTYLPKPQMGSASKFQIYSYKGGKLKCLLDDGEYGMYKIVSYPKSKSFVAFKNGHGGESQTTYVLKKGKFRPVAERARSVWGNAHWIYYKFKTNAKNAAATNLRTTSKTKYRKLVGKLAKGKKRLIQMV